MRRRAGFTLIELMIVVAIIGILAAVAIPAFLEDGSYIRISEGPIPWVSSCDVPGGTFTAGQFFSERSVTGAFKELEFAIDDRFRFQYIYIGDGATGLTYRAEAFADLDCDRTGSITMTAAGTVIDGKPVVEFAQHGTD